MFEKWRKDVLDKVIICVYKKPDVTNEGDSSFDKINISLKGTTDKESRYQQGMTNYACETEENGNEDS